MFAKAVDFNKHIGCVK